MKTYKSIYWKMQYKLIEVYFRNDIISQRRINCVLDIQPNMRSFVTYVWNQSSITQFYLFQFSLIFSQLGILKVYIIIIVYVASQRYNIHSLEIHLRPQICFENAKQSLSFSKKGVRVLLTISRNNEMSKMVSIKQKIITNLHNCSCEAMQ